MDHCQIFISYRRNGGDILAGRIADRLKSKGYLVFLDVDSLRTGTYSEQILEAISKCDDVLVVLPPNALDRCNDENDWVKQELSYAFQEKKNVIPVLMNGFVFPKVIPNEIKQLALMEGVVASSMYFDATIEKIERLLTCKSKTSTSDVALKYQSLITSVRISDYLETEGFIAQGNDIGASGGVFYLCKQILSDPTLDDESRHDFENTLKSLKIIYRLAENAKRLDICAFMQSISIDAYRNASRDIKGYMLKNVNSLRGDFVDFIFQTLADTTNVKRDFYERLIKEIYVIYRCAHQDY